MDLQVLDFNEVIIKMVEFLKTKQYSNFKTLAFIDPFGLEVKWNSIEMLKDLAIDMWILIPTGIGVPDQLNIPFSWKKPKVFFVNSMSDLFHVDISLEFIQSVFQVMNQNPQHIFQVLVQKDYLKFMNN